MVPLSGQARNSRATLPTTMADFIKPNETITSLVAAGFAEIVLRNPVTGEERRLRPLPWVTLSHCDARLRDAYIAIEAAIHSQDAQLKKLNTEAAALRERVTGIETSP